MRTSSLLLVVIVLTLVPVTWAVEHVMVESKDLQWEDVSALPPGAKVAVIEGLLDQATPFILQFKFPADCKIPAHWHPSIAHVLVLSGTLNSILKVFVLDVLLNRVVAVSTDPAPDSAFALSFFGRPAGQLPWSHCTIAATVASEEKCC